VQAVTGLRFHVQERGRYINILYHVSQEFVFVARKQNSEIEFEIFGGTNFLVHCCGSELWTVRINVGLGYRGSTGLERDPPPRWCQENRSNQEAEKYCFALCILITKSSGPHVHISTRSFKAAVKFSLCLIKYHRKLYGNLRCGLSSADITRRKKLANVKNRTPILQSPNPYTSHCAG
jgi:hypothetical protein